IWILESACVTDPWWCKRSEEIPRGCFWSKHFPFQNWENYGQLFPEMYTPRALPIEYGGLFGAYLKKLSLARTRREKDGDAESGCQTSTKAVSLKDRVKAMESLCTSLMILPKEIKSLKAHVYKVATIINVITKKESNLKHMMVNFGDLGDKYWSDKDGEIFSFNVSPNQSANKDLVNELVDALDDLVDENGGVEVEKDLSEVKVQKLEAENKRLAEQRRIRFHKMKEQENDMRSSYFSNSTHMKLALEKCGTNKRKFSNVFRPSVKEDTYVNVFSIDTLKKQKNMLDQYMIEKCQQLKPWGEEDDLIGLDDKCLVWLLDSYIQLWVWYMWYFRQSCHDWSIVRCYFLTLLLQDSMPFFYVTDKIYPMAWRDVEQVFIPINEPKRHWSLAQFHIQSGNVTFYDSQKIEGVEYRPWYLKMRSCLETKLRVLLHRTGMFASKGIDPNNYSIKFGQVLNVPQQGGLVGDCGVFVCLFLYRNSYSCNEIVLDIFYNGCFIIYPFNYDGDALELKISKVNKLSYKQMCDLLVEKVNEDIWHWFYCKPDCCLEAGLTIVGNDKDVKIMYEMANLHGHLEVYVAHFPQYLVTDYYLKNLCVDETNGDVTKQLLSHQKIYKEAKCFPSDLKGKSLLDDFDEEEGEGLGSLSSKRLSGDLKGKSLLDDFDEEEGEGLGSLSSKRLSGDLKCKSLLDDFGIIKL
nr:phospholipase-like protein [Tanacetum cinerariifolium]